MHVPAPPPPLPDDAHKGTAGRLLCVAGSATMPGAAHLVVRAALRAGAGLVTLAVFEREVLAAVAASVPETTYLDLSRSPDLLAGRLPAGIEEHRHDVRVAGPGLGASGRTRELVRHLVGSDFAGSLLLDADGLNVLAGNPEELARARGPVVITPHPGEAARLLGRTVPDDEAGRAEAARELARRAAAVCVLKGHGTVVTDGERTYRNGTGNAGMATAGSGDVLTGITGAYLAGASESGPSEWDPFAAACAAVYVHGLAGDLAVRRLGRRALVASDLIDHLSAAQVEHG